MNCSTILIMIKHFILYNKVSTQLAHQKKSKKYFPMESKKQCDISSNEIVIFMK